MLKINIVLFLWFACVECQSSEQANTCTGPQTMICNAGGLDRSTGQTPVHTNDNKLQGRPGKSGSKGIQGVKGQKGEQGIPEDNGARLRQLESEVRRLRQFESVVERLRQLESEVEKLNNSNLNPPKSCDHINGRADRSGIHLISPDSSAVPPFYVYCNFTGTTTETIISHDSTEEVDIGKCEPRRCYKRKIRYNVALPQVIALIEQSESCRQFIKYRCTASLLFHNQNPTFAAWLSRDGTERLYWGGATSRRDRYCACGETGTCVEKKWKCNCDKNNSPETSDEGYLTDKDSLPVTELQFGDAGGSDEHGWHTLGRLICSGRRNQ